MALPRSVVGLGQSIIIIIIITVTIDQDKLILGKPCIMRRKYDIRYINSVSTSTACPSHTLTTQYNTVPCTIYEFGFHGYSMSHNSHHTRQHGTASQSIIQRNASFTNRTKNSRFVLHPYTEARLFGFWKGHANPVSITSGLGQDGKGSFLISSRFWSRLMFAHGRHNKNAAQKLSQRCCGLSATVKVRHVSCISDQIALIK